MKAKLGKEMGCRTNCVGLRRVKDYSLLENVFNNQTLSQLKLQSGETFEFYEMDMPEVVRERIMTE